MPNVAVGISFRFSACNFERCFLLSSGLASPSRLWSARRINKPAIFAGLILVVIQYVIFMSIFLASTEIGWPSPYLVRNPIISCGVFPQGGGNCTGGVSSLTFSSLLFDWAFFAFVSLVTVFLGLSRKQLTKTSTFSHKLA